MKNRAIILSAIFLLVFFKVSFGGSDFSFYGSSGGGSPNISLPISIENGGTGATNADDARSNLGLYGGGGTSTQNYVIQNLSSNGTITSSGPYRKDFCLVNASGGNRTVTLQTAVGKSGHVQIIKKIDSSGNVVTIAANGSEVIDGANTRTLDQQYAALTVISNGAVWYIAN